MPDFVVFRGLHTSRISAIIRYYPLLAVCRVANLLQILAAPLATTVWPRLLSTHQNTNKPMKYRMWTDTRRQKLDCKYPVKIEIRNNRVFNLSTGISVDLDNLGPDGMPKSKAEGAALRKILSAVEIYCLTHTGIPDAKAREDLEEIIGYRKKNRAGEFTSYLDKYMEAHNQKENTADLYTRTRKKVDEFDPHVLLSAIDSRWVERFDAWMERHGLRPNSRSIFLRNVRAVIKWANRHEQIIPDPFARYTICKEEPEHRALTMRQLLDLYRYQPLEGWQEFARDMFMLSFYLIGVNLADLMAMTHDNVVDGRLVYRRQKTGRRYSVKIEPEAGVLLAKYAGKKMLFSFAEDSSYNAVKVRVNRALKRLGSTDRKKAAMLPGYVCYYSARHTWATVAYSIGIPSGTISDGLGHEHGCPVTFGYIDIDTRLIDEANRRVIDSLKGV